MIVQLFCDNTLLSTFEGSREEIGVMLKETARNLGLDIDQDFELQNRLTVIFKENSFKDISYQTDQFRFRLHVPERAENAA